MRHPQVFSHECPSNFQEEKDLSANFSLEVELLFKDWNIFKMSNPLNLQFLILL